MYIHKKEIIVGGVPLPDASKALILLHGRGASAESMLSLSEHIDMPGTAFLAPQATNRSWYPYSFLAPPAENQPALDSALNVIDDLVKEIFDQGITLDNVYFLGFSQGACLSLEYAGRYAAGYGGVVAFTGGLIGDTVLKSNYIGNFKDTPILITTGDPDPHVPLSRVEESVEILDALNASVTLKVYKGRQHTIQTEEIELAQKLVFNKNGLQ